MTDNQIDTQHFGIYGWENATPDDWKERDYVISFLHWDGENHAKLNDDAFEQTFMLADGFGDLTHADPLTVHYDWSHVRDSSIEAIYAIGAYLRWKIESEVYPTEIDLSRADDPAHLKTNGKF